MFHVCDLPIRKGSSLTETDQSACCFGGGGRCNKYVPLLQQ